MQWWWWYYELCAPLLGPSLDQDPARVTHVKIHENTYMCLCVGDEYFNIYIVIANIQSDIPAGALSTAVEYQMM